MSSEFKLSDQTSVALPVKNIVAIISAIVVAVWTYFGIVERLNRLETNEKLNFNVFFSKMGFFSKIVLIVQIF